MTTHRWVKNSKGEYVAEALGVNPAAIPGAQAPKLEPYIINWGGEYILYYANDKVAGRYAFRSKAEKALAELQQGIKPTDEVKAVNPFKNLIDKWKGKKNVRLLERDIAKLNLKEEDIADIRAAIEDYEDTDPKDIDERDEAWDNIVDAMDSFEPAEVEPAKTAKP